MSNKSIKMLVVDDEEGIVDMAKKLFTRRGFETYVALDGATAVKIFQEQRPQINIIDIHLAYSSLDGIDVLKEIKTIDPDAVCIMVTRITDKEKVEKARELGALHYITKPLNTNQLIELVQEAEQLIKHREDKNG